LKTSKQLDPRRYNWFKPILIKKIQHNELKNQKRKKKGFYTKTLVSIKYLTKRIKEKKVIECPMR